jgi:hypothetical protein
MINRRALLIGLLAAPTIVRVSALMPLRGRVLLTSDTTIYVDMLGSDLNDGLSPLTAVKSMQKVLDQLDLNDHCLTFQLASGVYSENLIAGPGDVILKGTNHQSVLLENCHIKTQNRRYPLLWADNHAILDIQSTTFEDAS